jgi:hypothetical protein
VVGRHLVGHDVVRQLMVGQHVDGPVMGHGRLGLAPS